jgi:hypothetical protein
VGIAVHLVPIDISVTPHIWQTFDSAASEYFLDPISHTVQFDEPVAFENFPASHEAQEIAPEVLAFPAVHALHSVDGGRVPIEPAGHARNGSQLSSWQLVM